MTVYHKEIKFAVPENSDSKGSLQREVFVLVGGQWSARGVTFEYKGRFPLSHSLSGALPCKARIELPAPCILLLPVLDDQSQVQKASIIAVS